MSQKYTLGCMYYTFDGHDEMSLKFDVLGEFDTHEDALWRQIELQEEFISIVYKNPHLESAASPMRIKRNVDDIIHILHHYIHSTSEDYNKVKKLIEKHPVLTHKEYYIRKS
jgi:DNA-directed RNA polymerase subunit L